MAKERQRPLHRFAKQGEGAEIGLQQPAQAQGEVARHHLDLTPVGAELPLQVIDVERGLGQALELGHGVDGVDAALVAQAPEQGGPGGLLEVHEEVPGQVLPRTAAHFVSMRLR